ncbi:hypothetical protein HDV00_002808 [Rhizophlyctis rosea]|nr:hypothetical protein HDV00_002808 [Rhizophlyctis rosea]
MTTVTDTFIADELDKFPPILVVQFPDCLVTINNRILYLHRHNNIPRIKAMILTSEAPLQEDEWTRTRFALGVEITVNTPQQDVKRFHVVTFSPMTLGHHLQAICARQGEEFPLTGSQDMPSIATWETHSNPIGITLSKPIPFAAANVSNSDRFWEIAEEEGSVYIGYEPVPKLNNDGHVRAVRFTAVKRRLPRAFLDAVRTCVIRQHSMRENRSGGGASGRDGGIVTKATIHDEEKREELLVPKRFEYFDDEYAEDRPDDEESVSCIDRGSYPRIQAFLTWMRLRKSQHISR